MPFTTSGRGLALQLGDNAQRVTGPVGLRGVPDTSRQRRGHLGTDAIVGTPLTCTDVARRT